MHLCTVYGDTQHTHNTTGSEQGNRKPPFTLLYFLLPCDTHPPTATTTPTKLPWKAEKTYQTDLIYPHANISRHMWSIEQNHCSAFQVTGPRHSPEDWEGGTDTIPFVRSVRALLSGMQWDSIRLERIWADKLINEYNGMKCDEFAHLFRTDKIKQLHYKSELWLWKRCFSKIGKRTWLNIVIIILVNVIIKT